MKFILFSDIHFHNWPAHAKILSNGLNSRLVHTSERMKDIIQIAVENKADGLIFAGDFFHVKKVDSDVIDVAVNAVSHCPLPIWGIPGNHDMASFVQQTHSARAVSGKVRFLDNVNGRSVQLDDGSVIYGIPFTARQADIKAELSRVPKNTKILIMHQGVFGAVMGEGYIGDTEDSIQPKDLYGKAELTVCGHFHTAQFIKIQEGETYKVNGPTTFNYSSGNSVLIPGAVEQHNFGDKGQERGCWLVDTNKKSLQFFPLSSPKFVEANDQTTESECRGNYVRFLAKGAKRKESLASVSESFVEDVSPEATCGSERDYHLSTSDSMEKVLQTYIANANSQNLDVARLLSEGKRLLA